MVKTIPVSKDLQALSIIASTDKARPALAKVVIEKGEAKATDGYMLGVLPVETKDSMQIPANLIQRSKITKMWEPVIEVTTNEIRLREFDISYVINKSEPVDFPKTKQITDVADKNKFHKVTLGVDVLSKLVQVMKKAKSQQITMVFDENPLNAIRAKTGELKIIIMPMRSSEADNA